MIMMLLIVKAICWASDFHLNCSDSELQRDPGPVELIFLVHKPAEIVNVVPKLNTTPNKALHSNTLSGVFSILSGLQIVQYNLCSTSRTSLQVRERSVQSRDCHNWSSCLLLIAFLCKIFTGQLLLSGTHL